MTAQELFHFLTAYYGIRKCFISEIAEMLHISYAEANYLTYTLGYRRGKAYNLIDIHAFSADSGVQRIAKRIVKI